MGKISKSYLKDKYLSTKGYKRNSPDVNNPYNVIPSNQITMKGVDFPVLGVDNFGNRQLMQPGSDYTFPGNYVKEFPMRNMGNNRFQKGGTKKAKPIVNNPKKPVDPRAAMFLQSTNVSPKTKTEQEIGKMRTAIKKAETKPVSFPPVTSYRKQVDNTVYNPPVKTLRETYETPGQIMKEWEREERINNILTKVDNDIIPALDVTTDLMQTGNFVPHPIGQAVGKIGNAVGSLVDLYQFGRNLYDEEYGDATLNLASAILPGFLGQSTFRRNSKYLKPGQTLYPLSPQAGILPGGYSRVSYIEPFNRVQGMSAKNLLANRALLGTLGAETLYDMGVMSPKPIYNQFEGARDNVQINNVNRNNLYTLDRGQFYQMGGTIGIPGVNGQVVSSGSYPITSVKKTRGSLKKDNKGNVKTMSNQQVKQVLKYSKQKPNKI